jgi:hypothetical protein
MMGGVRLNCYQMLETLHVIINKNEKEQFNFWEQEIYSDNEFAEACLNVNFLLKERLCKKVDNDEGELEKTKQEMPTEHCPFCGKNLVIVLSEQEKKYNLRYISEKIGISN